MHVNKSFKLKLHRDLQCSKNPEPCYEFITIALEGTSFKGAGGGQLRQVEHDGAGNGGHF